MYILKELSFQPNKAKGKNIIVSGENLQAMAALHKYKGQVDLIVTDPPYNTGKDFRYNDKYTNWAEFMQPRLQMMKQMLKENGVLAICIDDRELFCLGMLLNEVFGEENRIGIINWQKAYSPKNDSRHLSSATEYILVYAKNKEKAKTNLPDRTNSMNSKYKNPDNDPKGPWASDNPCASRITPKDRYAIQSPFSGALHYPGAGSWRYPKKSMKMHLEAWGSKYTEQDIKDGRAKALVIKGAQIPPIPTGQSLNNNPIVPSSVQEDEVIKMSEKKATIISDTKPIPIIHFLKSGYGRPRIKRYLADVKQGKVPLTYWANDNYDELFRLGSQSWPYEESGHSQTGINELDYIVGKGHNLKTVKPIKLIQKVIQLWCPGGGIVFDPFAGSGTVGHAVIELNEISNSNRSFILVEKGETGDEYAKTLTRERIKRAITGERIGKDGIARVLEPPIVNGFEFWEAIATPIFQ